MITGKIHRGAVRHIAKGHSDKSVCGRYVLIISAPDGVRLCKSCAKITGTESVSLPNEVHTDDVDALNVLETVANAAGNPRAAAAVRSLPDVVKRTTLEWFSTMRVLLNANAKRRPVDVLADLEKSRDWAFATLILNAVERGEILPFVKKTRKLVEYRMDTAPTESDQICNGDNPIMPTAQRGGGDGMVNPNSKSVARGGFAGTPKQLDLIHSLISQINEITAEIYPDVKPLEYAEEYISSLSTFRKVRSDIDGLFEMLRVVKEKRNAKRAEIRKEENKANPAEDGYYIIGETFVTIKWNRAHTGQYATVWDPETESWEYDSRASYKLVQDAQAGKLVRASEADAVRFGELYGRCMRCSRTLTDPDSILAAMGKICREKMGF